MWTRDPTLRAKRAATRAPRLVVPLPVAWRPRSFKSISAKKLSDGLLVSRTRVSIRGEWTLASSLAEEGVRPLRGRAPSAMPRRRRAVWSLRAAYSGGLPWNADPLEFARPRLNESALSGPTQIEVPQRESGPPRSESKLDSSP